MDISQFVYPFTHSGVVSIFCLSRMGGGRGGMHNGYSVSFWADEDIWELNQSGVGEVLNATELSFYFLCLFKKNLNLFILIGG